MKEIKQILKYLDIFGEKCSFYVEKNPKLYSVTGGILSIFSISISFIIFILTSLDDFQRISPIVSISSTQPNQFHKIKFGKEKIWIPWRIQDYSNNYVNHTNLLYPLIYNFYSIKKAGNGFEFGVQELNYTLCNETSFVNKSEIYDIDSSLDELYCIEMDDIDVGGDWTSEYISYIEFDLYLCKEGIDYDENNPYCTNYQNISHYLGENNSLSMSLYYPIANFKANESINPMNIIYRERFYQISRFSNKIDRIFLQKNILKDDYGWFFRKYNETSYWSLSKFEGDSYTNGDKRDLMNEGSTSRVYSFNIYLEPTINTYFRTYKKIYIILSECLPFIYFISFIFKMIASFCKVHTINKKFAEFLFTKLKAKTDIFEKKVKEIKLNENVLKKINNHNSFKKVSKYMISDNNDNSNNIVSQKNIMFNSKLQEPIKEKADLKDNSIEIMSNNKSKELFSSKSNNNLKGNKIIGRHTIKSSAPSNEKRKSARKYSGIGNIKLRGQSLFKENQKEPFTHLVNQTLFPSRYYFYIIFIKNYDILKKTKCFSKKFSNSYMFITKLLDIYSYFDLIRQFNVFKTCFLSEENMNFIERNRKINIGEMSFMKNIKDCLDNDNFRIFGRIKQEKKNN